MDFAPLYGHFLFGRSGVNHHMHFYWVLVYSGKLHLRLGSSKEMSVEKGT